MCDRSMFTIRSEAQNASNWAGKLGERGKELTGIVKRNITIRVMPVLIIFAKIRLTGGVRNICVGNLMMVLITLPVHKTADQVSSCN